MPGTVLADRYRVDALLGEGGMGKVYAAEHVLLRKRLAIKILRSDRALVPEIVARFEREAMAAANIEHPNIAGASDFGRLADGSVFLVLEYVQGRNLRDEIAAGPLSVQRSLHVARQIASALAGAQELGIVHRDLKPENVMLIQKGGDPDFVKVLDFGIARVPMADGVTQPLTKAGMIFGTPEYMAPEQALGQPADGRSDLYGLGIILFEMITGSRPFEHGTRGLSQRVSGPPPAFADRAPGIEVPRPVEALVQKLLSPDVKARFQTAGALIEALDELLVQARQSRSPPPVRRPPRPSAAAPRRAGTFMPGDPLPAFELTNDSTPVPAAAPLPVAAPARVAAPPPHLALPAAVPPPTAAPDVEPPTLLRAPSVSPPPEPAIRGVSVGSRITAVLAAIGVSTIRLYRRACDFVDANRKVFPGPIRRRLRRVSAGAFVWAGLLLGVLLLLGIAALFGAVGRDAEPDGSAVATRPPQPERQAAAPSALPKAAAELVQGIDLAAAHAESNRDAEALAVLEQALRTDPALRDDPRAKALLLKTARSGSADLQHKSLSLLEGPMAAAGADAVYELAFDTAAPNSVRERAERWLKTKDFDRASSPALYSAVRLRQAQSCEQKHRMLKLAGNVGGEQTLQYLRELQQRTSCSGGAKAECYPCLAKDAELKRAIQQVEARLKG